MSRNAKLVVVIVGVMFSMVSVVAMVVANIQYNAGYESGYSLAYSTRYSEGYDIGFSEGNMSGYESAHYIAYDEGYLQGFTDGNTSGYEEGYDSGYSQGVDDGARHGYRFPKYVMAGMFIDPIWTLFDENGIAMVDYGGSIGIQYNPVTISQYALYNYHQYFDSGNETAKETFFNQADWLVEHARQKANYTVWEYEFDWNYYNMTDPFVSAMAQGLGVSVLVRAYNLSMNAVYLNTVHSSINAFEVEMDEGGVRYTDSDGIWFEEYADENCKISKVLNGFIFSLFGLYEVSGYSSKADELFWVGTNTLASNIHRYDTGSWSCYDLLGLKASEGYHKLHVKQLQTMYDITGDEIFLEYSNLFHSYQTPNQKTLFAKIHFFGAISLHHLVGRLRSAKPSLPRMPAKSEVFLGLHKDLPSITVYRLS